jgi:hypothetical protein
MNNTPDRLLHMTAVKCSLRPAFFMGFRRIAEEPHHTILQLYGTLFWPRNYLIARYI